LEQDDHVFDEELIDDLILKKEPNENQDSNNS
jgi:hypothetical protein